MEEFCEGAERAAAVVIVFLAVVSAFHALAIAAAFSIWLFDKVFRRRD